MWYKQIGSPKTLKGELHPTGMDELPNSAPAPIPQGIAVLNHYPRAVTLPPDFG
jgi:hypothetical protein